MNNRKHNSTNRFQTEAKRVLCVCSAGLLRSPTIANILHDKYGYNTRAAGIDEDFALIPVDEVLLEWADEIVLADVGVLDKFVMIYGRDPELKRKTITLAIPDMFMWNAPELRKQIEAQYAKHAEE